MKRLLIAGAGGQLGSALYQRAAKDDFVVEAAARDSLDIRDSESIARAMQRFRPDVVINAAAYTAVDAAESDPEQANAVNAEGTANLARACREAGAHLLHVSTDFVFDGSGNSPYAPDAPASPLGAYGRSKHAGELVLTSLCDDATIVRTAWLYGPGGSNFVRTMLRLLGQRERLGVVCDQVGAPTHTHGLADALLALGAAGLARGATLHWTDAGVASWYDLAEAVRMHAQRRWPDRTWGRIDPIPTEDYPTPAKRPRFSVLDTRAAQSLVGPAMSWQARLENALMHDPEHLWL